MRVRVKEWGEAGQRRATARLRRKRGAARGAAGHGAMEAGSSLEPKASTRAPRRANHSKSASYLQGGRDRVRVRVRMTREQVV